MATGSNAAFQLGGNAAADFNLTSIGPSAQYRGFKTLNVVGGDWTVSGAGSSWNVNSGTLELAGGSVLAATTVKNGAVFDVLSGATASNTTVSSGGDLVVSSGGMADRTRVLAGGSELIASGGVDNGGQISGGFQDVFGSASGTTVSAGAQIVEAGALVSGTIVKAGGTEIFIPPAS